MYDTIIVGGGLRRRNVTPGAVLKTRAAVGWGLAGFCLGPALTALGFGSSAAVVFVAAMMVGMFLARWLANRPSLSRIATTVDRA